MSDEERARLARRAGDGDLASAEALVTLIRRELGLCEECHGTGLAVLERSRGYCRCDTGRAEGAMAAKLAYEERERRYAEAEAKLQGIWADVTCDCGHLGRDHGPDRPYDTSEDRCHVCPECESYCPRPETPTPTPERRRGFASRFLRLILGP